MVETGLRECHDFGINETITAAISRHGQILRTETGSQQIAGDYLVNVFGIGLPEMALIMIVALLIFGPKKLPEIGRSMGKAIRGFQDASREFETEFKREAEQLEQVVKTPTLPESQQSETKEIASTEINNHAATSSQKS